MKLTHKFDSPSFYAQHNASIMRLSCRTCICLSISLSVGHTLRTYRKGTRYDHKIFTVACHKTRNFIWHNFAQLGDGVSLI